MFDEEEVKDIQQQGNVTKLLGDNETSDDCDFNVKYKDFDEVYETKLVEEWKKQCTILLAKANQKKFEKIENYSFFLRYILFIEFHWNMYTWFHTVMEN